MAGDTARVAPLAHDLEKRFPLDAQMQSLWLQTIQGHLALDKRNPTPALIALQAAITVELRQIQFVGNISCLQTVYVSGKARLAAGRGSAAAAEFQKILYWRGAVLNEPIGALAHLCLARAYVLQAGFCNAGLQPGRWRSRSGRVGQSPRRLQ